MKVCLIRTVDDDLGELQDGSNFLGTKNCRL